MSRLTDEQLSRIQAYVDRVIAELKLSGLSLVVGTDLGEWARFMRTAPGIAAVTTTFDPEHSYVHPGNSFWISLRDQAGAIVGCNCFRLFVTDDVLPLIRSWRLFFDRQPLLEMKPLRLVSPSDIPIISGRVGYGGGYWLHPSQRGKGLTRLVPRVCRALGLRHFDVDWVFGLHKETPGRTAMARESYGLPNQFPCIRGYFPPRGEDGAYRIAYIHRGEMLQLIYADAARPGSLTASTPGEEAAA